MAWLLENSYLLRPLVTKERMIQMDPKGPG